MESLLFAYHPRIDFQLALAGGRKGLGLVVCLTKTKRGLYKSVHTSDYFKK
jgi:hypothetical protein